MPETPTNPKQFVIACVGIESSGKEWKALPATLNKVDLQIRGHRIVLNYFGNKFACRCTFSTEVRYFGLLEEEKLQEMLEKSDIVYCSQSFESELKKKTRERLPAELPMLLGSGRPLLFQGPPYTKTSSILKSQNAAAICHSKESVNVELYHCLDRLIFDREFREQLTASALRVAEQLRVHPEILLHST